MEKEIRWGIAGLGNIAHQFAQDLQLVSGAVLTAVGSRNLDRAKVFGNEYQATHCFGSYRELFECEEVDVIYIATPHTSHRELSIQAMKTGKHVLCEKPMAINAEECREMISVCKNENRKLSIGYRMHYDLTTQKIKEMADILIPLHDLSIGKKKTIP